MNPTSPIHIRSQLPTPSARGCFVGIAVDTKFQRYNTMYVKQVSACIAPINNSILRTIPGHFAYLFMKAIFG